MQDGRPRLATLQELHANLDADAIGRKAAGLAGLLEWGLPVPRTWVAPTRVLLEHLERLGLRDLAASIEAALAEGQPWQACARHVRAAMLEAPLPPALEADLAVLLHGLPQHSGLAIRSSAACEGAARASIAGQFESYLGITTLEDARTAVRSCWASLWSPQVLRFRAARAGGWPAAGMAVLVQMLVPALAAGAARADAEAADVEAVWGLGGTLMSGLVTPDVFRVARNGMVVEKRVGLKTVRSVASRGNVDWQPVPASACDAPSIDEDTACDVAALAFRVADAAGTAVEIEWALHRGQLWVLRWRPQSGWALSREDAAGGDAAYLGGIPSAPGLAVGPVRIVGGVRDLQRVGPHDVAVTAYFAPLFAPLFRGAAIVTEVGGTCSHGATIARERGIPVVTGVAHARQRLAEGSLVRVDGSAGTIHEVPDG